MINVKQKGAEGEREICKTLNAIIQKVMRAHGYPEQEVLLAANAVQRNQNQSAVGGNDLTNTFGMSIEVKRQEQLSINTWWQQTTEAASRNGEHPVLLYRQNGKKWKCVTMSYIELPNSKWKYIRVEFDWETFQFWFHDWVEQKMLNGERVRK